MRRERPRKAQMDEGRGGEKGDEMEMESGRQSERNKKASST